MKQEEIKIRRQMAKLSLGVAAAVVTTGGILSSNAKADEATKTTNQAQNMTASNDVDLIAKTQSQTTVDNVTTTTTTATLDPATKINDTSLQATVAAAKQAGFKVIEKNSQTYADKNKAYADYAQQISALNQQIVAYQAKKAQYQADLAKFEATTKTYQKAQAEYEKQLASYQQEQAAFKIKKAKLQDVIDAWKNNKDFQNPQITSSKDKTKEDYAFQAQVKFSDELQAALNQAKEAGITIVENESQRTKDVASAKQAYQKQATTIQQAVADFKQELNAYQAKLATYQQAEVKYEQEKQAYEEYQKQLQANLGAGAVIGAQKLLFDQQTSATMTISGADKYITKEAAAQLDSQDVVSRFDKTKLDAMGETFAYQTTNPYAENENAWVILKKGQPVTVTYQNLTNAFYDETPISKVTYTYTLESSSDGSDEAMAQIMHDPTETIWVGSNTKSPADHLTVKMDIVFYDEKGNKIDTKDGNALISLASLNHYTGIPYVTEDGVAAVIPMEHIERVNLGNNEFVEIPGSSVTINEDGWAYAKESNQRQSEGSQFDADDTFVYVNQETGEQFTTTDKNIAENTYVKAHGGVDQWKLISQTIGWDDLPSATADGKWPVNKYYGAGALRLIDGTLYFDVSGNNPDFQTSYWFVLNSAVAVPHEPGEKPVAPSKPTMEIAVQPYRVEANETLALPTMPAPKFDHEKPAPKPNEPQVSELNWHQAKVFQIEVTTIPDVPPTPDKPGKPETPTPNEPGEPETPTPPTPDKNTKQTKIKNVVTKQKVTSQKTLPQTGQADTTDFSVMGLMAVSASLLFGFAAKRRKAK